MTAVEVIRQGGRRRVARRTDKPLSSFERPLRCTECGELVLVGEASTPMGVDEVAMHEHLDAASYVCGDCLGELPVMELLA